MKFYFPTLFASALLLVCVSSCKKDETPVAVTLVEEDCSSSAGFAFDTSGSYSVASIQSGSMVLWAETDFSANETARAQAVYDFTNLNLPGRDIENLCLKIDFNGFDHNSTEFGVTQNSDFSFQYGKIKYGVAPTTNLFIRGESLFICINPGTTDFTASLQSGGESTDISDQFYVSSTVNEGYHIDMECYTLVSGGFFSGVATIDLDYFKLYSFDKE